MINSISRLNDFIFGKNVTGNVIFSANNEELEDLKKYVLTRKNNGVAGIKIVEELFRLGWTKDELTVVMPIDLKKYDKRFYKLIIKIIVLIGVGQIIQAIGGLLSLKYNNELFEVFGVLLFIPIILYIIYLFFKTVVGTTILSTIDRRILLFFNRLDKKIGLNTFVNKNEHFSNIKIRNKRKFFLPVKESSPFKVFGGQGKYQGKGFNIFIAKKYSHTEVDSVMSTPIYKYYIFYEFDIKEVPFYFSLVREGYFEKQSQRLQNSNLNKGDFQDIDFSSREFNKKWKLRGSDKKMAYQVFGPHMQSLILKFNQKDFIGLEISDQSVMLSTYFSYHAVKRTPDDFNLLYEIAKQVERNYREIEW